LSSSCIAISHSSGDYYGHVVYIFSEDDIEIFLVTQGRYNFIKERLEKYPTLTREQVRDTLLASL